MGIYCFQTYDWVFSLEVAEHIPKESEGIYLDNLVWKTFPIPNLGK